MKNNESGEFELVLGNRQLLSGFFIVVILFAVFFVMGYIVGRNSSPAKLAAGGEQTTAAVPSEMRPQPSSPKTAAPENSAPAATEPAKEDATERQPATKPAKEPETKTETPSAANTPVEPAPGETYLQVVSVAQHEAEIVARTLKDKGFPSSLSPGPTGRTRVLVGPYADISALGKAKADLENLGFHPIVKR
jgi:cell division septation protein DedD